MKKTFVRKKIFDKLKFSGKRLALPLTLPSCNWVVSLSVVTLHGHCMQGMSVIIQIQDNVHINTESVQCISTVYNICSYK